ncbi:MAG TPA: 16S rRNA (guanine(527)-N(7))-methyltransferase RsmG [Burkholderiaceae bacterium]|nr:16S rRNA (guanine(527)-N(7))-methyltransferase RsmG [Burkholderiaceae bacterium]
MTPPPAEREPTPDAEGLLSALEQTASRLSPALTAPQARALIAYVLLLQRWNATYNLTSVRDPGQMLVQHLADCLAVVGPLRRHAGGKPLRLLDVGSGAGLPGVVIATALAEVDVTCVDTVGKKAAFVRQAAAELRLPNLHAEHARVERLRAAPFDVVASRAFASLADFVSLTRGQLSPAGVWMAMKGKHPGDEMAALSADIDVFHVEQLTVPGLDAERCLVWMRVRC